MIRNRGSLRRGRRLMIYPSGKCWNKSNQCIQPVKDVVTQRNSTLVSLINNAPFLFFVLSLTIKHKQIMGYTTDFKGQLELSRTATTTERTYINAFSKTRRMGRLPDVLMEHYKGQYGLPAPLETLLTPTQLKHAKALKKDGILLDISTIPDNRTAAQIYGEEGEFFAHPKGEDRIGVIDYNRPPKQISSTDFLRDWKTNQKLKVEGKCQPGLWCNWIITPDGKYLEWNGAEKFHDYVEWLQYLITNFFQPWGIKLNGQIKWSGDDTSDVGIIMVKNNTIKTKQGKIVYQD